MNCTKRAGKNHRKLLKLKREKANLIRRSAIRLEKSNPEKIKELEEEMKTYMQRLIDDVERFEKKQ